MANFNDRGAKKWVSLMLPEHVKMLREWEYHVTHDEEQPMIADNKLEELDEVIQLSLHENLDVHVCYYDPFSKAKKHFIGEVRAIDPVVHKIKFITHEGRSEYVKIKDIFDIRLN